jgi:hypothetical protein
MENINKEKTCQEASQINQNIITSEEVEKSIEFFDIMLGKLIEGHPMNFQILDKLDAIISTVCRGYRFPLPSIADDIQEEHL